VSNPSTNSEFSGAAVVVVGGHLGTGPAVVRAFVERGAKVVVGLLGAAQPAPGFDGVTSIPVDLSDRQSILSFWDACDERLGGLAIVVMVAPPVKTKNALEFTEAEYRAVIDQELVGPILCIQEAARRLVVRGGGRIISFASMSGKTGVHQHTAPYAAAKGGLITFSRVLAAELAPTGVTVNVIATALFDVQVAKKSPAELAETVKGIPVGRVGRSEEAAHAVLFLASRDAGYVTGETVSLSGGRFMD
jgi:NAD(P)-dependent dehydrogenase (short-subunit alcohol dehydrogenase family)